MTDTTHIPENLLPMTPAMFNILLALADGEKHGYAIMLEVEANTRERSKWVLERYMDRSSAWPAA
jgi:hypothetical protein